MADVNISDVLFLLFNYSSITRHLLFWRVLYKSFVSLELSKKSSYKYS